MSRLINDNRKHVNTNIKVIKHGGRDRVCLFAETEISCEKIRQAIETAMESMCINDS